MKIFDYILELLELKLKPFDQESFFISFLHSKIETKIDFTQLGLFTYVLLLMFSERACLNFYSKKADDTSIKDVLFLIFACFILSDLFQWSHFTPVLSSFFYERLVKGFVDTLFYEPKPQASDRIAKNYNPIYLSHFMKRLESEED